MWALYFSIAFYKLNVCNVCHQEMQTFEELDIHMQHSIWGLIIVSSRTWTHFFIMNNIQYVYSTPKKALTGYEKGWCFIFIPSMFMTARQQRH